MILPWYLLKRITVFVGVAYSPEVDIVLPILPRIPFLLARKKLSLCTTGSCAYEHVVAAVMQMKSRGIALLSKDMESRAIFYFAI
jgi:hypothetical protein